MICHSDMQHLTILSIIQAELTRRLTHYADLVDRGHMDRETANFRYLCLQTAAWIAGGDRPKTVTLHEETMDEIQRWMREIQRNSTVETMHADGRVVALLQEFLEANKPAVPAPVQTRLI